MMPANRAVIRLLFCLLAATAGLIQAQTVSIGVKGGFPLADPTSGNDESPPYIVGPSVEVWLPAGFAIEADALYRRIGNSNSLAFAESVFGQINVTSSFLNYIPIPPSSNRYRGNSWEFPVIGKYYFRSPSSRWQPFVGTGYAFRTTRYTVEGNLVNVVVNGIDTSVTTTPYKHNYVSDTGVGAVFAAGVRFHAGRFAVLPEFRYTRWGSSDGLLKKNEANVIVGVSF